jgi:hypothetical protein
MLTLHRKQLAVALAFITLKVVTTALSSIPATAIHLRRERATIAKPYTVTRSFTIALALITPQIVTTVLPPMPATV